MGERICALAPALPNDAACIGRHDSGKAKGASMGKPVRGRGRWRVWAAMGLLLCAGEAWAQTADSASPEAIPKAPITTEAPARRPLMDMLDRAGWAKGLDDLGISIYGHVEGSY